MAKKNLNQPDNDTCREKGKSLKNLGRHSSHFQKRKIKKLKYEFVMVLFYFSIVSMFVYALILAYEWFNEPCNANKPLKPNSDYIEYFQFGQRHHHKSVFYLKQPLDSTCAIAIEACKNLAYKI